MPDINNKIEAEIKGTVLRPLANKFQELTRKIDGGKHELPKTMEAAELITEGYINQAYERLTALIQSEVRDGRIKQLKRYLNQRCGCLNCDAIADDLESLKKGI